MRAVRRAGERVIDGAMKVNRRAELGQLLMGLGPRTVYGGLLFYTQGRGSAKAEGWACYLFKELYGEWPRQSERGPPVEIEGYLLNEWMDLRPKPPKRVAKVAPLLERLEVLPAYRSELMTAADWEVFR